MSKILFPFQLNNDIYKEAYIAAVKIARNLNAELILLNAFELDLQDDITEILYHKMIKNKWIEAYNEIVKFNKYFLSTHVKTNDALNVRIDHRFVHGEDIPVVTEIIQKEEIDLLIFPLSSNRKVNKRYMDCVKNEVFNYKTTSVLFLPQDYKYTEIENILFTTDLKELNFNEYYFSEVLNYSNFFDAKIHFVHVNKAGNEIVENSTMKLIDRIIQKYNKHVFKSINAHNIVNAIQSYIIQENIQLLSVVKSNLDFFQSFFHSSVSFEIIDSINTPILLMNEKNI